MITQEQKKVITSTVAVLRTNGVALTTHFYNRMFKHNPELKNIFNMGNQQQGKQQTALAMAVLAYAEHIAAPEELMPVVNSIGHKHVSVDIRPEQYVIVGKHLIASIQEVLGTAASPEIIDAWTVAYSQLAQIMSGHEAGLYREQIAKEGGWTGFQPFVVKSKVVESEEITSFYLYPTHGGAVSEHVPGQYLSIRMFLPELGLMQLRQYSISSAPCQDYYRISVKRELGKEQNLPNGMISNHLHERINIGDVVEASAPAGTFNLINDELPAVFLSGGIGQTPLVSMVEYLLQSQVQKKVLWIHGARNQSVHAFRTAISSWKEKSQKIVSYIFYDEQETSSEYNIYKGIVDVAKLPEELLPARAQYYICGPSKFIEKQYRDLQERGIDKQYIHYEEFGPQVLHLE